MTLKINYINKTSNKLSANRTFSNEKYQINNLKKYLSDSSFHINDLLKISDLKKIFCF